ncbi:hypothetical protein DYH09_34635, partial [bacterium CPR1]|nr:hypothetical protein [bacterium CPR1]
MWWRRSYALGGPSPASATTGAGLLAAAHPAIGAPPSGAILPAVARAVCVTAVKARALAVVAAPARAVGAGARTTALTGRVLPVGARAAARAGSIAVAVKARALALVAAPAR